MRQGTCYAHSISASCGKSVVQLKFSEHGGAHLWIFRFGTCAITHVRVRGYQAITRRRSRSGRPDTSTLSGLPAFTRGKNSEWPGALSSPICSGAGLDCCSRVCLLCVGSGVYVCRVCARALSHALLSLSLSNHSQQPLHHLHRDPALD